MHPEHSRYAVTTLESKGCHHYIQYMRHGDKFRQDMRPAHSRYAFAALDKLIVNHYIQYMRHGDNMTKVYILLEMNLETEYVRVQGVYATPKLAEETMNVLMDFNEEDKYYYLEEKVMQ